MAKIDYKGMAEAILKAVGGAGNIEECDFCSTRIRFDLNDASIVDTAAIKACGCPGVIKFGKNSVQVIVGMFVNTVFDELQDLMN